MGKHALLAAYVATNIGPRCAGLQPHCPRDRIIFRTCPSTVAHLSFTKSRGRHSRAALALRDVLRCHEGARLATQQQYILLHHRSVLPVCSPCAVISGPSWLEIGGRRTKPKQKVQKRVFAQPC